MMFYVQDDLPLTRRQVWGRLFGACIEKTREAGYVPDPARLRPMAGALECGYEKIALLVFICQGAWEQ
jgi:hypothetical protein